MREHDYGFTSHFEDDLKPTDARIFQDRLIALQGLRKMVMPLLEHLKANPEREIIKWPNRGPVIDEFVKKMDEYIASQTGGAPCADPPVTPKGRKK